MVDWEAWHRGYERPGSALARRLAVVQDLIRQWLDRTASRRVRIASVCAGDGRDILELIAARPDAARAHVVLLESDPRLSARARKFCEDKCLAQVDVRTVDAGVTDAYIGVGPVDLLLLAGVFGNIADDEIRAVIDMLPAICAPGCLVVWTRRPEGRLLNAIDDWFAARSFLRVYATHGQRRFHVTAHRFMGDPERLKPGRKLFTFVH